MADRRYVRASPAQSTPASDGVSVVILTRDQRRDIIRALTVAIDTDGSPEELERWSLLIPLIDPSHSVEETA